MKLLVHIWDLYVYKTEYIDSFFWERITALGRWHFSQPLFQIFFVLVFHRPAFLSKQWTRQFHHNLSKVMFGFSRRQLLLSLWVDLVFLCFLLLFFPKKARLMHPVACNQRNSDLETCTGPLISIPWTTLSSLESSTVYLLAFLRATALQAHWTPSKIWARCTHRTKPIVFQHSSFISRHLRISAGTASNLSQVQLLRRRRLQPTSAFHYCWTWSNPPRQTEEICLGCIFR